MTSGPSQLRLSQLWQLPLLLVSLGLFGFAAYLAIDPQPALTAQQKIARSRDYLRQSRPEAAIEQLNRLLTSERLHPEDQAVVHLLLAEALEAGQLLHRLDVPANHHRIIEQTQLALGLGIEADARIHRRLAESYEALGRTPEALSHYRQAIARDADQAIRLEKKVIGLQVQQGEHGAAMAGIENYLQSPGLTDAERAWAIAEKGRLLIEQEQFDQARLLLEQAVALELDPVAQGQFYYHLGYCAWKLSQLDEAERLLRLARNQLRIGHPLDADAAWLLGIIHQGRDQPLEAISFFQVVLTSHPDAAVAPRALLGRGICRIILGEHDAGLVDLEELVRSIGRRRTREQHIEPALAGLRRAADVLSSAGNFHGALEVMASEQSLMEEPPASFFARLASAYERRADQVERMAAAPAPAEQIRRAEQVRELRTRAGDAHVAYSRAVVLTDDRAYGDALWRGIELYDRAGNLHKAITALELFVAERPDDPLAPDALLRLGRAYRAAGMFDRAIAAYQRNQLRYPQSLAASKSAVPLAQAYIAQGPQYYARAETVLLSVLDNNPLLTPDSEEFRQALFEIGQLYYRTEKYEQAVARLAEATERYPNEPRMGQILFFMADSYRKSAALLESAAAGATASAEASTDVGQAAEASAARRERLQQAKVLFDRVIQIHRDQPPGNDTDRLHQKLSHFYRADCVFDLGEYEEAIRLYDTAAFRYQNDPSALAAYMQIVNANVALGRAEEARTANERAKWLLRRMPAEAFAEVAPAVSRGHWEQWLKWAADSGMW